VQFGAVPVFVDVTIPQYNIDVNMLEAALSERTKAVMIAHTLGNPFDLAAVREFCDRHSLWLVEDNCDALGSEYTIGGKTVRTGSVGDIGTSSFYPPHHMTMGEGGAVSVNNPEMIERAEILREKGTNRAKFFRGQVDKYNWVDIGDSFLPSELNAAYLYAQLEKADEINADRLNSWEEYNKAFKPLEEKGLVSLPVVPEDCVHNAHMYYLKCRSLDERTDFINFLKERGVMAVFHYVPLHSAPAGLKFGRFHGEDKYTTADSDRLVRLPMYYGLNEEDRNIVIEVVKEFYSK
jgi:dTDP-4-amino-4,6-dideoxygalactose transaminase